jgi:hypothetical protein
MEDKGNRIEEKLSATPGKFLAEKTVAATFINAKMVSYSLTLSNAIMKYQLSQCLSCIYFNSDLILKEDEK